MTNFQNHIQILSSRMLNLEKLWEFAGFQPNKEQRDAILHVDGPLFLTAGPGSGKTRVLLWRTLNLIVFHGVNPDEIFLSTFTEKAALQLKEGLQSILGIVTNINGQPYDLAQMYIGTVHSLCQRILSDRRRFTYDRHRNRPPSLMDELAQYFHISKHRNWRSLVEQAGLGDDANLVINTIFGESYQSKHVAVNHCISVFNRFSEECIDPDQALDQLRNGAVTLPSNINADQMEILLKLYAAYKRSLFTESGARQTDFSLLQQEAYRVLESFPNSGKVFKHIIVDEYQDTNTIQEQIFFKLAEGTKNICVVGDDDQALYRFRGATVENFVEFPNRCMDYLHVFPTRIPLSVNYRSREGIVQFYSKFMEGINWAKANGKGFYRVIDKDIQAKRKDVKPAVVASTPTNADDVCQEIAKLVRQLIDEKKVDNPNQIAFLFPSMKYQTQTTPAVTRMIQALEAEGLKVYAPRAGRFLEVDESYDVFGILLHIFGRPKDIQAYGRDYDNFKQWLTQIEADGSSLRQNDPLLDRFIKDKREELVRARTDYLLLAQTCELRRWDLNSLYQPDLMKRTLINTSGLSDVGKKLLSSTYMERVIRDRIEKGQEISIKYVLARATSIDWNLLDLFYRLCGFDHFKKMFDDAESGQDEGPVANLSLITQYLSRFMDEYIPIITAEYLLDGLFQQVFFFSYVFALYRLGETEYEDADDPFPKGRIPFLTIHQAKGLEFPVVVLGNARKDNRGPNIIEVLARPFMSKEPGEPLDRQAGFDIMRMFYVALSRAKNLLIIAHYQKGQQYVNGEFKRMLGSDFPRIPNFNIKDVPAIETRAETLPKVYSFTSDFLTYKKCPRQYMIFRKYEFVPSRSQTMFFGSLVHETLEDLHHELIRRRQTNG